jgi:SulP family sulfate permease
MLTILVAFSGIVGVVPMPILAAVLIYAAVSSLRAGAIGTIWRTGRMSQIAVTSTFLGTLFLPVAVAVGVGVALSLLLQLNREALDLRVTQLQPRPGGRFAERPAPATLPSRTVTLLDVYGSLYYAGAKTLAARLPDPGGAKRPVVVLRLRGRTRLGATSVVVIDGYAKRLADRRATVPQRGRHRPGRAADPRRQASRGRRRPGGHSHPGHRRILRQSLRRGAALACRPARHPVS